MNANFFFPFAISALAAAFSLYFFFRRMRSEIILADRLAGELGLNFESRAGGVSKELDKLPPFLQPFLDVFLPWRISGPYREFKVWIYPEIRSAGKSAKTFLVVKVDYPTPLPFAFRAGRETAFIKLGKALFNLTDVEVGEWAFDAAVLIKSDDPAAVSRLFARMELRDSLLSLLESFPEAFADKDAAKWERRAVRSSFDHVPAALDLLADFVAALVSART